MEQRHFHLRFDAGDECDILALMSHYNVECTIASKDSDSLHFRDPVSLPLPLLADDTGSTLDDVIVFV
jgi:hypothetical protein